MGSEIAIGILPILHIFVFFMLSFMWCHHKWTREPKVGPWNRRTSYPTHSPYDEPYHR